MQWWEKAAARCYMFESVSSATIKFQRFAGQQDTDSMHMLSYLYEGFQFYIHTDLRTYVQ